MSTEANDGVIPLVGQDAPEDAAPVRRGFVQFEVHDKGINFGGNLAQFSPLERIGLLQLAIDSELRGMSHSDGPLPS